MRLFIPLRFIQSDTSECEDGRLRSSDSRKQEDAQLRSSNFDSQTLDDSDDVGNLPGSVQHPASEHFG